MTELERMTLQWNMNFLADSVKFYVSKCILVIPQFVKTQSRQQKKLAVRNQRQERYQDRLEENDGFYFTLTYIIHIASGSQGFLKVILESVVVRTHCKSKGIMDSAALLYYQSQSEWTDFFIPVLILKPQWLGRKRVHDTTGRQQTRS